MTLIKSYLTLSVIFSLICFVLSCSNVVSGATFQESSKNSSAGSVTLLVKSQDNIIDFSSARSILPSTESYSSMYFYLWGKNKLTGDSISVIQADFNPGTDSTTGTISIDKLSSTSYELYLGATKEAVDISGTTEAAIYNIKQKLYFIGFATADLRYSEQVLFYLTPYGVEGKGTVNLKIYFPWTVPSIYNVSVSLNDLKTNEVIRQLYTTDGGQVNPSTYTVLSSIPTSVPANYNYVLRDITPGTYNLTISFYGSGTPVYVWSDKLLVLANRSTSAEVAVSNIVENPDIASPSDFVCAYSEPETSDAGNYFVEFCWNDNSDNETNFELELLDVSKVSFNSSMQTVLDTTASLSDKNTAWSALSQTYGITSTVYSPSYYGDSSNTAYSDFSSCGSLVGNNTFIVYNFLLGTKYMARLRAVNNVGSSDYVYLDISNSCGKTLDDDGQSRTYKNFSASSSAINLFRIKYNQNGGYYYDAVNAVTVNSVPECQYLTQTVDSTPQVVPLSVLYPVDYEYDSADSTKKASLRNADATLWTKWQQGGIGGEDMTSTYSGFENLYLFAYYDGTNYSGITLEANSDIMVYGGTTEENGVVIAGGGTTKISYSDADSSKDYRFTVTKASYQGLWFLIANTQNSGVRRFSDFSLSLITAQGISKTYSKITEDENYPRFFVDLSDSTNFPVRDEYYFATLELTPTTNQQNKVYFYLKFKLTD